MRFKRPRAIKRQFAKRMPEAAERMLSFIKAVNKELEDQHAPPFDMEEWVAKWTKPAKIPQRSKEWIRSVVSEGCATADLVKEFPPNCLVKAKAWTKHCVPKPGFVGIVINCSSSGDGLDDGPMVKVVHAPNGRWAGMCRAEDLEVVGYWSGLTPEVVQEILDE